MPVPKNQTAAKTRTRTAKTAPATSAAAAETAPPPATGEPAASDAPAPAQAAQQTDESGNRVSVTIPLDGPVVGLAVKAATLPLTAAKKVAQNKNGIPAYAAVGGLAVLGAVEWPVAAVGGLGLAALRRWGPLKPEQDSTKNA